jgi:hypothetical protein
MIPFARQSLPALKLPVILFVVAAAAVVFRDLTRNPLNSPRRVQDVVDRLHQHGLHFHVVPVSCSISDLENGAYLCRRKRPWKDLARLRRAREYAADWVGVVHVERCYRNPAAEINLAEWGPHAAGRGTILLFGDTEMIRQIVQALDS